MRLLFTCHIKITLLTSLFILSCGEDSVNLTPSFSHSFDGTYMILTDTQGMLEEITGLHNDTKISDTFKITASNGDLQLSASIFSSIITDIDSGKTTLIGETTSKTVSISSLTTNADDITVSFEGTGSLSNNMKNLSIEITMVISGGDWDKNIIVLSFTGVHSE